MSDGAPPDVEPEGPNNDSPHGPNLVLLYTLIALALVAAILLAAFIVRPFYLRR
ncbi:MAG TPA: hypothetical protein VMT38_01175 [Terracidiphilus sp.]|nr:hypothetical protein [Terracidiphilus sp.]